MTSSWENNLYHFANACMETSWEKWIEGKTAASWGCTLPARLAYLADAVINIVILPFALIRLTFCLFHGWSSEKRKVSYFYAKERANHLFLSTFGAVISPALASKYRDANITPYIIAARVMVISGFVLYYVLTL